MSLNIQKGNMYGFVTHTWNTVKGKCPHDCVYCYMKSFPQKKIRFDASELKTKLGFDNFIFVGSSNDLFADAIPSDWIKRTLEHCRKYDESKYMFQTKNPKRFMEFIDEFPNKTILCTTIETNRENLLGNAPPRKERAEYMKRLSERFLTFITIEPIMDFDHDDFVEMLMNAEPGQINVGADSKRHNLPEPNKVKLLGFIKTVDELFKVHLKDTIKRLYN